MSITPRPLSQVMVTLGAMSFGALSLGLATGCADLTRPDEIVIIAEPPPAPRPPAPTAAVEMAGEDASGSASAARAPGMKKAGG